MWTGVEIRRRPRTRPRRGRDHSGSVQLRYRGDQFQIADHLALRLAGGVRLGRRPVDLCAVEDRTGERVDRVVLDHAPALPIALASRTMARSTAIRAALADGLPRSSAISLFV